MEISRRQFGIAVGAALLAADQARGQTPPPREVPWLAEIQARPPRLPADFPRLPSALVDATGRPIANLAEWQQYRPELRRAWLELLGTWPPAEATGSFEIQASETIPGVTRRLISYESEPGVEVEAYLLLPARVRGRLPGVVVFHSTVDTTIRQPAGLDVRPELAWGLKLAERGCAVICPRCYLWNDRLPPKFEERVAEHKARHPEARGMAKMLFDGQRALDVLAGMPEVDPERLGVAGHSLGAKEALYLAAFDDRVKVAVSSEGGIGTTYSNWDAPWYLDKAPLGREHHELLALIAPRAFLLIGGDSADGQRSWPFIEAALEVYRLWNPTARVGLYNHAKGHSVPPLAEQRTYEWLLTYL